MSITVIREGNILRIVSATEPMVEGQPLVLNTAPAGPDPGHPAREAVEWEGTQIIIVSCIAILLGAGLWTLGIASACSLISCLVFMRWRHGQFYRSLLTSLGDLRISWKHELLPMQWRIALSCISGYFVFQLFTPVIFHYQGPVEAGRMGMTLQLVGAVGSISGVWLNTRIPLFGTLVAQHKWPELDALAWRVGLATVTTALFVAGAALTGILFLRAHFPVFSDRFLPVGTIALFLGAAVLLQITSVEGVYLRAFRREPLMWISLVTGCLTGLSTWQFGRNFGANAVAVG